MRSGIGLVHTRLRWREGYSDCFRRGVCVHCLHCFGLYFCIRRVPSSRYILLYHLYCIPGAYTCIQAAAL